MNCCCGGGIIVPPGPELPGGELFVGTWNELRELTTANNVVGSASSGSAGSLGYCTSTGGMALCLFADADGSIWTHIGYADPSRFAGGRNHFAGWDERDSGGPSNYVEILSPGASVSVLDQSVNAPGNPGVLTAGIDGSSQSRAGVRIAFQMARLDVATQVYVGRKKIRVTESPTDNLGDFNYALQLGLGNTQTTVDSSDYLGFVTDGQGIGDEIVARSADGGSETDSLGPVLAPDTWFDLLFDAGPLSGVPTARFVVDGVLVGTHVTNLPGDTVDLIPDQVWIRRQTIPPMGGGDMLMFADFTSWEMGAAA